VLQVTQELSIRAIVELRVELLKAKILHLIVEGDNDDNNNCGGGDDIIIIIIIIMSCNNNFNWKHWVIFGPKLSVHLEIRITGVQITEGPLYMDYC